MTTVAITTLEAPASHANAPSAVSWPAVFAGAAAAAAISLVLLVLGTGLGLAVVSPWAGKGVSATAIAWSTIAWLAFTAFAASGLGGYIAGRLRVRWAAVHNDEVYFRDTAHGFLSWAVATLVTASVLATVVGTVVGAGAVTAAANDDDKSVASMYLVDGLFRRPPLRTMDPARAEGVYVNATAAMREEMARVIANGLSTGNLPAEDVRYAGQQISISTGLTPQEAEARINSAYANAKAAADAARKNAAYAALWLFVSLLLGAFTASFMATWGGRRRDLH